MTSAEFSISPKEPPKVKFEWEKSKEAEGEKKSLTGLVSIGGKKYKVTVGYNENVLKEKYDIKDETPEALEQTIQKIIEEIKPEDIIKLAGSQFSTDSKMENTTVLHAGKEYALKQLVADSSKELQDLGKTVEKVINAFSKSEVMKSIQRSRKTEPLPDLDLRVSFEEQKPLPRKPAVDSALKEQFAAHLQEATIPSLFRAYGSLCELRKLGGVKVEDLESQLKMAVEAQTKFSKPEDDKREKLLRQDPLKPEKLTPEIAISILQKDLLKAFANPEELGKEHINSILKKIESRFPKIHQQIDVELGNLLKLRSELWTLNLAEAEGIKAISDFIKSNKQLEGIRKDIKEGKISVVGEDERSIRNRKSLEESEKRVRDSTEGIKTTIESLLKHVDLQEGSSQNSAVKDLLATLSLISKEDHPMDAALSWEFKRKVPLTLANDLAGAYSPAFGDIAYLSEPDIAQIKLAHGNLEKIDPVNQAKYAELSSLLDELAAELKTVNKVFSPLYKPEKVPDRTKEISPEIKAEIQALRAKIGVMEDRVKKIEFVYTKPESYRSIAGIVAAQMQPDLVEFALSGDTSKEFFTITLERVRRNLQQLETEE